MKKIALVGLILCSVPIGLLGCSEKQTEQVNTESLQSELNENKEDIKEDSSEKTEGSFYLYKDCINDYNNPPNLIGDVKSNLKFHLDTDISENGYLLYCNWLTEDDLNNINHFSQIEDILLKHEKSLSVREVIEIDLDEEISNPNIILNRAEDIGAWMPNQNFKILDKAEEVHFSEMELWSEYVLLIAKLDGLALNSTEDTKFKILNYMIDNIPNIEHLETKEEVLKFAYLNVYLQNAFIEADPSVDLLLDNLGGAINTKLELIYAETTKDVDQLDVALDEKFLSKYLEVTYKYLEEVKNLE